MVAPRPEFARLQHALAAHLRDPRSPPPPGIEDRRLEIYRHAVFAGIDGFMRDNYPRVLAAMDAGPWRAMVRDYLVRHVARATAFVDLPREFLDYLEREAVADPARPFLYELAHFDWLETLIGADARTLELEQIDRDGDLLAGVPVANPIMCLVRYRFPVHVIGADYQPVDAPAATTHIAAFRATDNEYGFLDLSAPAARLLELIMVGTRATGRALVAQVADEIGRCDIAALVAAAGTILARMQARDVILGTARA